MSLDPIPGAHTLLHVLFLLTSVKREYTAPLKPAHIPSGDLNTSGCPGKLFPERVKVPPFKNNHRGADGTFAN